MKELKSVNRRDFLRLAGLTAGGAALVACTPPATQAPAPTSAGETAQPAEATQAPAGETVQLRMWCWDQYVLDAYVPIAEQFSNENPGVSITMESTAYNEYSQKVATSIAGGKPPDVVGTIAEHFTVLAGQNLLLDLKPMAQGSGFDLSDYLEGNLSQNSWEQKLYSLPYTSDAIWILFDVKKFGDAGVKNPYQLWKDGEWTWEKVTELAEQFSSGSGAERQFGFQGIDYNNFYEIGPYISSNNGTGMFDEEYTKCVLNEEASLETYQWGFNLRQYMPTPDDQQTGTPQSGRIAMFTTWSPFAQLIKENTPFEYSYAPPPASKKSMKHFFCGDAPGFGIVGSVKNKDLSWSWLVRMNQPDAMSAFFNLSGQEPPRMSVATDPAVWKANTAFPNSEIGLELTKARFEGGWYYNSPKVSNYGEMLTAYSEELSLAWADSQTLEEALGKATERINALLPEASLDTDKLIWNS